MIQSDELIFFEGSKPSITGRKNGWNHVKPYETSHVPYPPAKWQWKILVYRWFSHYQWIGFREILQENPIIHVWFPVDFPLNQSIDIKTSISKGVPIMFDNQRVDPKSSQGSWSEAEAWFPISCMLGGYLADNRLGRYRTAYLHGGWCYYYNTLRALSSLPSGWWFGTMEFYGFPSYWECHHPNWRKHIFQRGRAQPPTCHQYRLG